MAAANLANKPSLVEKNGLRFVILDAPSDNNLPLYLKELQKHNVSHIVRVCDPTYSCEPVEKIGITVHDWPFADGEPPPAKILDEWLNLVEKTFPNVGAKSAAASSSDAGKQTAVAVHCVAGLGRAPVLVAIALIESGMEPLDAISFIRERRRGAINSKQMKFLEKYKPRRSKKGCCMM